jgi:hypothetical protein
MEDPNEAPVTNVATPNCVDMILEVECYDWPGRTQADYDNWVEANKPDCWCYQRQCRGDGDGTKQLIFWVFSNDLAALKLAYGKNDALLAAIPNGICSDYDHTKQLIFRVFSNDLAILKTYYGKNEALVPVCSGPGSGNDANPLPNSEYNFWTN